MNSNHKSKFQLWSFVFMAEKKAFVPPFLEKLGLKPGEWMYTSKASLRALMRPYWPLKIRIWACLMIQSFGYESDLSVAMSRGDFEGARPKIHPLTPALILMTLKREAMKAFKSAGMEITEEQSKEMRVSKHNLRRCLVEMEEQDGLIVRTVTASGAGVLRGLSLNQAITRKLVQPLRDLPIKERSMLAAGNVCIYLNPTPNPATKQALIECLPSTGEGVKFDPLQGPQLKILHGLAKHFCVKCDETRFSELLERAEFQDLMTKLKDLLVSLSKEAVPAQDSTALNPTALESQSRISDSNASEQKSVPPGRRAVDSSSPAAPQGRQPGQSQSDERQSAGRSAPPISPATNEPELVSRPQPLATRGRDLSSCDSEFAGSVIAAFVEGGRPSPNLKQVAAVQRTIPDLPDAREEFVAHLRQKMPRIKTPGILSSIVEEFNLAWPALQVQRQEFAAQAARIEAQSATTVTNCGNCGGSGLVGDDWDSLGDAIRKVEAGAKYCSCEQGAIAHDAIEPELIRKAGRRA